MSARSTLRIRTRKRKRKTLRVGFGSGILREFWESFNGPGLASKSAPTGCGTSKSVSWIRVGHFRRVLGLAHLTAQAWRPYPFNWIWFRESESTMALEVCRKERGAAPRSDLILYRRTVGEAEKGAKRRRRPWQLPIPINSWPRPTNCKPFSSSTP